MSRFAFDHVPSRAPIVPDETLDALAASFAAHGGVQMFGSFEAFVHRYAGSAPRAHARVMQRRAIDRLGRQT